MDTRTILRKVKDGSLSIEEAELAFGRQPYEELGYAKLDENRKVRQGFPEVIYCSNKPDDYLVSIYCKMFEENGEVFGTRASIHQYEIVKKKLPQVQYDEVSKILKIEKNDKKLTGRIAVCSAGTADIPVAEEAAQTAEFFGTYVDRIYDVGVSGLHRLLSKMEAESKLCCCRCRNGRSFGKRSWWSCEKSGYCCAYVGRLRCKHGWSFGTSYND